MRKNLTTILNNRPTSVLLRKTDKVSDDDLTRVCRAMELDFARLGPIWYTPGFNFVLADSEADRQDRELLSILNANPDMAGANGEHSYDLRGPTLTSAFNVLFTTWPQVLSHEHHEAAIRPYLDTYVYNPANGFWYPKEISDPVNPYSKKVQIDDDSFVTLAAVTYPLFWLAGGYTPSQGPLDDSDSQHCPAPLTPAPGASIYCGATFATMDWRYGPAPTINGAAPPNNGTGEELGQPSRRVWRGWGGVEVRTDIGALLAVLVCAGVAMFAGAALMWLWLNRP